MSILATACSIHAGMDALSPMRPEALPRQCLSRKVGGGSSNVLGAALMKQIADAHGVSTAQVALRWLTQQGIPAITAATASQTAYMKEDLAIFNWTLSAVRTSLAQIAEWSSVRCRTSNVDRLLRVTCAAARLCLCARCAWARRRTLRSLDPRALRTRRRRRGCALAFSTASANSWCNNEKHSTQPSCRGDLVFS